MAGLGVLALALVAAAVLLLPGLFRAGAGSPDGRVGVVPAMPRSPHVVRLLDGPQWTLFPGEWAVADAGLVVRLTVDDAYFATEVSAAEISGGTLWSGPLTAAVCGVGQPGAVSCAGENLITTYDLRTGRVLREFATSEPAGSVLGLADGGVLVASWPGRVQGGTVSGAASALTVTLARHDRDGTLLWRQVVSVQATLQRAYLRVVDDAILLHYYGPAGGIPNQGGDWVLLAAPRSLANGARIGSIPDGGVVDALPGGRLLVRGPAASEVFDKTGQRISTLGRVHRDWFSEPANDGTFPGLWTDDMGSDRPYTVTLYTDDGRAIATAQNESVVAACGGLLVTRVFGAENSRTTSRVARNARGEVQWRVDLPVAGTGAGSAACDGTRVIEALEPTPADTVEVVAYDGSGVAWRHSEPNAPEALFRAQGVRNEGFLLYANPEDGGARRLLMLR